MSEKFPTRCKCPRCGSRSIYLIEEGIWISSYQVDDGVLDREGFFEPGEIYKVRGDCRRCRHSWTIRGAVQITDCYSDPRDP